MAVQKAMVGHPDIVADPERPGHRSRRVAHEQAPALVKPGDPFKPAFISGGEFPRLHSFALTLCPFFNSYWIISSDAGKKQSPRVGCRCVRLNTFLKSSLARGVINAMTRLANVLYWAGCFLAVLFAACAVAALNSDS